MTNKMDKMLYRMITGSMGQVAAVITIIVAGILIFVAMSMTSVNMTNTVDEYYRDYKFADLFVEAASIPEQKIRDIEALEGIETAEGRVVLEAPVVTDNDKERVNVRLITSNGEKDSLNKCFLIEGRWHEENSREALVLNQFADARGIGPGDKISIQSDGVRYTLNVVGIAANPEFIYLIENSQSIMPNPGNYGVLYVSEAFGQQLAGTPGAYNDILISYYDFADEESLIDTLKMRLRQYGVQQIIKQKDQPSNNMIQSELSQINNMSSSLPFVFIAVAGLVLVMMLGRMVKRDRIKIGILKAIGYGNEKVLLHYVKYAVACGLIGGFAGAVLGMLCSGALTKLYLQYFNIPLLRVDFYPLVVVVAVFASVMFCAISGIIGARGILKISPAVSMQSEPPKAGKRIFIERIPILWKKLSFSGKMVWKNVFRNKKRSSFVLLGIALTYAMMLFTTSMPGVMNDLMNKHYLEFQKMDYIIGLKAPVKESAAQDLRHLVEAGHMEGKLEYPFELEKGNRRQVVSIIGIKRDTAFYTFKNSNGDIVELPETGLLITENLAKNLKIKKGDLVKINTFIPDRQDVYVEVRDIIKQTLGINAYMNIDDMGQRLMEKNVINGIYLDSEDERINEKLVAASNIASVMSVEETRAIFEEYMATTYAMIAFMIIFSGILGFCVVYNATVIAIGEREMEFSSLRVLGFGKEEIFGMILRESSILTVLGILAGIPIGIYLLDVTSSVFSTDIYSIYMTANLTALISAAIFTALFILIAQFATYQKIKKLDLLQALKNRMS